jgi:C4-dicarboxylate transporter DctM subunit
MIRWKCSLRGFFDISLIVVDEGSRYLMIWIFMLVPILFPIGRLYGVEEHHLALIIVMAVQIALITPPMAIALFIVTPMAGSTIRQVSIEVIPFIALVVAVIITVLFFPAVAMWLPHLVM